MTPWEPWLQEPWLQEPWLQEPGSKHPDCKPPNPSLRSGLASLRSASSICLGFGRPSEGDLEEILLTARRRWTDAAGRNGSLYPKRKDKADGRTHTLYKGVSVQGPVHHRCP